MTGQIDFRSFHPSYSEEPYTYFGRILNGLYAAPIRYDDDERPDQPLYHRRLIPYDREPQPIEPYHRIQRGPTMPSATARDANHYQQEPDYGSVPSGMYRAEQLERHDRRYHSQPYFEETSIELTAEFEVEDFDLSVLFSD